MVKVIFLDAGGTLIRPHPSVGHIYSHTATTHGVTVDPILLEKRFREAWKKRNGLSSIASQTTEKEEKRWWRSLVEDVFAEEQTFFKKGTEPFSIFFEDLYERFGHSDHWRLFDDSLPLLETLKAQGFRLAILSNWDHRLFGIVEGLGIRHYFEDVFASAAVGVAKPHAGIFQHALDQMKVRPEECLHVGDSMEDDYHGARQMGIKGILLERGGNTYNDVISITSLKDLPSQLCQPSPEHH